MNNNDRVVEFILKTDWPDLPQKIRHQSKRCLLDTLGAMIAGHRTPVGDLIASFARTQFPGNESTILIKGGKVSASGAALVNGFANNALDIDDGYRPTMGHPGACILPVALAAGEISKNISGKQFLTSLVIGYEVGTRAGLIRHATYETYHSSGSWGAIAGAAVAGKLMGFDREKLVNALGAAEYHAPIAPMMKCIDVPGMGKDSIGWGCMVAMMSAMMADRGFTGINPIFDDCPPDKSGEWVESIGKYWEIMNLYFKPYSACRWAQPGVDGALKIMARNTLDVKDIKEIKVFTFKESAALSQQYPENTEQAQYNIPFPIAAAILDGEVGPAQTLPPRLFDPDIRQLMDKITITARERFQKKFPQSAESEVEITTRDGQRFLSGEISARWDAHSAPSDRELEDKFIWLASPVLGEKTARYLKDIVINFDKETSLKRLIKQSICLDEGEK